MARERLVTKLWAAGIAIVWAVVNVRAFDESDVFWHLALGREVLRHRSRTFPETMSFVAEGRTTRSQEWLWDVTTYLLHARFGWAAIAALVVVLAACAGIACCLAAWTYRAADPGERLGAYFLTTAFISAPVLARVRERPETAAMVLLPLMLALAHWLAAARPRLVAALFVIGIELLWAQLHPSFVLGPAVVAILAGPELVLGGAQARRIAALVVGGFAVAFLSNLPALAVLTEHLGGYAVQNVTDMQPPVWAYLNPTASPLLPSYAALGLFALVAMASARRVFVRPLVLALLGAAIALRTSRGMGPGAILTIPLAMASFGELLRHVSATRAVLASFVGASFLLVRAVQWFDGGEGGLGFTGLNPAAYPLAAAKILERAPAGTKVLTSYAAGGPLGFLLDGRAKTFLDSRTPLLFDDVDYGEARAIWLRADTLAAAVKRYELDAAVVERDLPICQQLGDNDKDWIVAMVEPQFTTFVRADGRIAARSIASIQPCTGPTYLRESACAKPQELDADLAALAESGTPGFVDYLRAERIRQCSAGSFDADALVALLTPRSAALGFLARRDGLLAWVYASAGREDDVRSLARPYLDGPWGPSNVDAMLPALHALRPTKSARDLFDLAYADQLETAPGWLEAKVASTCMLREDEPCTSLHALRAAALGASEAAPALCWLAQEPRAARTRADANAWLDVLRTRAPDAHARDALVCR